MSKPRPNRFKQNKGGSSYAALAILAVILLAVAGYLLFGSRPTQRTATPTPPAVVQRHPLPPQPQQPLTSHQTRPAKPEKSAAPVAAAPVRETPVRVAPASGTGQLAIIIDDMGSSMQEARSLARIGVPLTFSVIPGLAHYREVASFASDQRIETMIHMPMQSKEWPKRRLESNGLLVSMTEADIAERLEEYLQQVPRAAGANNHMGSEFTEHEDKMRPVLEALKGRGLFFVDSVTTPRSVGMRLSREMGIKAARRQVFLDNEQDVTYIKSQLAQAVKLARKNGSAIAICHPHPATIKALASALPALAGEGITLVPASQLVH